MNPRRWWWRLGTGLAGFAVLDVVFVVVDFEPDPLRLALLVGLAVAALGLVLDALADPGPSWDLPSVRPTSLLGTDPRLARYLSLLEGHVTSRAPDAALRDRLAALADRVLRQRHGLGADDDAGRALLGPDLTRVLTEPPRRLSPAEVERCLTRIEEL